VDWQCRMARQHRNNYGCGDGGWGGNGPALFSRPGAWRSVRIV